MLVTAGVSALLVLVVQCVYMNSAPKSRFVSSRSSLIVMWWDGVKNLALPRTRGGPYPRLPVELVGFRGLHAPFLKERRIRSPCLRRVQEIRGISLVFREMWDSTALRLESVQGVKGRPTVAPHISRKTSEIWGTRLCYMAGQTCIKHYSALRQAPRQTCRLFS